jgi:nitric oxide synthase-interacting protein
MTRHSKNNTAGAFFTSAERAKLDYGTQSQRLGRESFRRPDSCHVCLQVAVDPVCCLDGHLFCRECILTFIVTQRAQLAQQLKDHQASQEKKVQAEKDLLAEEQRKRVDEFERAASGIKRIKTELEAKGSTVDSAFWLPNRTPDATSSAEAPKKKVICPAGEHPIVAKNLISVRWSKENDLCICKICSSSIAKATGVVLLRECGHAFCTKCYDQVSKKDKKCPECGDTPTSVMALAFDGTGFANRGGKVEIKRHEPAFI